MGAPDRIRRTRGDRDSAHRVRIGSGNGIRDSDGLLLAAIGRRRRTRCAARVVVRRPSVRRGGRAHRCGPHRGLQRGRGSGRRSSDTGRHPRARVWLARGVRGCRRAGLAVGLLRGDPDDRRRRQGPAQSRLLRPASEPRNDHGSNPPRSRHQHLARLQRLRRTQPLHRRHLGLDAASDGARLPVQAAGCRPARDVAVPAGSAVGEPRRVPADESPVSLRRLRGLAELGAAVRGVGGSGGLRDRHRHQRRPRGASRAARSGVAVRVVPVDRSRRVLVGPDARHRRGIHRTRRQCGVLLGEHVVLAGSPRRPDRRRRHRSGCHDGRVQGVLQARPGLRHRSSGRTHHDLVGPPPRTAREPHDGRRASPAVATTASASGSRTAPPATRCTAPSTGSSTAPVSATATCSEPRAAVVGYECDGCDFTYRDGLPYPTGEDGTPANFEILGSAPAAHFTRTTASRPPAPNEPAEDEFIASRLFDTRDPAAVERISHGHAILGTYVSPGGGTVITSGSTDWVWGLAERDRHIEQITRNILDRLT